MNHTDPFTPPSSNLLKDHLYGDSLEGRVQIMTYISPFRAAVSFGIVGYVFGFPLLGLTHLFANFASRPNYTPLHLEQVVAIPLSVALLAAVFALLGSLTYNLLARFGIAIHFKIKQTENV